MIQVGKLYLLINYLYLLDLSLRNIEDIMVCKEKT
jgi:hypothetical protein